MLGGRDHNTPEPFFQNAPAGHQGRLLLLSYHFPPGHATGALRWQKLARYAAARGWELDVVTLDPSDLPTAEWHRLEELPAGLRCFGVRWPPPLLVERGVEAAWRLYCRVRERRARYDPANTSRASQPAGPRPEEIGRAEIRWLPLTSRTPVRAYYAWLDSARAGRWARAATALALRLARQGTRPAAVISCGPPHMVHEAGRRISRTLGIPSIIDMRDPWSNVPRLTESYASPLWFQLARRHEGRAIAQSTLVVANTEAARQALQGLYREAAPRIITVMNGFDDDPIPASIPGRRFLIAYAGAIYMNRNPRILFRAVARLVRELALSPAELGLEFIGEVERFDGTSLDQIAAEEGVGEYVRLYPPVPRGEAMEFLARATMLVNLPQDADLAIPSKVFDYMRYHAWLLIMARRGSAPELLLRETTADLVEPDDLEGLLTILRARYRQHAAGRRPPRLADMVPHCSRAAQAQLLFDALEPHLRQASALRSCFPFGVRGREARTS